MPPPKRRKPSKPVKGTGKAKRTGTTPRRVPRVKRSSAPSLVGVGQGSGLG